MPRKTDRAQLEARIRAEVRAEGQQRRTAAAALRSPFEASPRIPHDEHQRIEERVQAEVAAELAREQAARQAELAQQAQQVNAALRRGRRHPPVTAVAGIPEKHKGINTMIRQMSGRGTQEEEA